MKREEYLRQFLEEWHYPEESRRVFLDAYGKLSASAAFPAFERKLRDYETKSSWNLKEFLVDQVALADIADIHPYTLDFLLLALMTEHLSALFQEKGIDGTVFHKTVEDLFYKNDECWCVYGIGGTFVASWCIEMYDCSRVGLGRLQFELVPFGRTYEKDGVVLKETDKVINIHIPRDKTRLSKESIDDALSQAVTFFRPLLEGQPIAFFCYSWLLYPENLDFIPEKSNLRVFSSYFDIIYSERSKDWRNDAWRLFDTLEANPTKLPEDTSLRRAFKAHLCSGGSLGIGIGLRIVC